jgi:hypothetical protein
VILTTRMRTMAATRGAFTHVNARRAAWPPKAFVMPAVYLGVSAILRGSSAALGRLRQAAGDHAVQAAAWLRPLFLPAALLTGAGLVRGFRPLPPFDGEPQEDGI